MLHTLHLRTSFLASSEFLSSNTAADHCFSHAFIRKAYSLLLERVSYCQANMPPSTPHSTPLYSLSIDDTVNVPLERTEYPKVPFWIRSEWEHFKDEQKKGGVHTEDCCLHKKKDKNLPSKPLAYITNANGIGVTGFQASAIQSTAGHIWNAIAKKGLDPTTWTQAEVLAVQYYRQQMYKAYPNLRLCDSHWKADLLAVNEYPGWHRSRKETASEPKLESEEPVAEGLSVGPSMTHPSKKRKKDINEGVIVKGTNLCSNV